MLENKVSLLTTNNTNLAINNRDLIDQQNFILNKLNKLDQYKKEDPDMLE